MSRYLRASHTFLLRLIASLLICLVTMSSLPAAAAEPKNELLIGIEPEHNIFDQMERYRYLADYLSEQLGVHVKLTIMSRYGEVIGRFKSLRLDGAFLTSYTATMGIDALDLEPVANPVNVNGESTSEGYILVRKDSGISDVNDMQGKSIAFVDAATMEGYLFFLAYLRGHGITDINTFFNRSYFVGSHASAIFAVLDGRADIGAAKNTVFNRLVKSDPSIGQELKIIAHSPPVPEITLCIKKEIDQVLRTSLAEVLLDMDQTTEGREVLGQFKALRFVKSSKADFAGIEEMEKKARSFMGNTGNN